MAFNLQKVIKALLFSSSQPLSTKDIQTAFARFHEQATFPTIIEEEGASTSTPTEVSPETAPTTPSDAPTDAAAEPPASTPPPEVAEVPIAAPTETDAELYQDVPSLITATQIREAMTTLAEELRAANDVY